MAEQQRRRSSRFDQTRMSQPPAHKIPSLLDQINPPPGMPGPANGMPQPFPPPPPGPSPPNGHFLQNQPSKGLADLIPKAPYYELPAGMIVPLIKLEDVTVGH